MKRFQSSTASASAFLLSLSIAQGAIGSDKSFITPACDKIQQDAPVDATPQQTNSVKVALPPIKLDSAGNGESGNKWKKSASKLQLMPLPLTQSTDERAQNQDLVVTAEQAQLMDLWMATINRYPDIQFAIERLQPNSDPKHAAATAIRTIGNLLFSGAQTVPSMLGPNFGAAAKFGTGAGISAVNGLLGNSASKQIKQAQISQEQATMLYQMVRNVADRLTID